jgi:hypothetical protein
MNNHNETPEDFSNGFCAGFETARKHIENAVEHALANGTSVRRAIKSVKVPEDVKVPTGLEYRGG